MPTLPKVSTCLWFDDNAEEAARFYTSLVPDSEMVSVGRPDPAGSVLLVQFTLGGAPFQALNGGPAHYTHSEAASISVSTEDQEETDRLWTALTAGRCSAWARSTSRSSKRRMGTSESR